MRTASLFEADRLTLEDAIELSIASLAAYGDRYRHWAVGEACSWLRFEV